MPATAALHSDGPAHISTHGAVVEGHRLREEKKASTALGLKNSKAFIAGACSGVAKLSGNEAFSIL